MEKARSHGPLSGMRRPVLATLAAVVALLFSALALAPSAGADPSSTGVRHRNVKVCAAPKAGDAACLAIRRDTVDADGKPAQPTATAPKGLTPAEIQSAYGLSGAATADPKDGPLVAVVDAYDAPTAEQDLAVYRKQFGLPPCTTANGCFRKVNQDGRTSGLPRADGGWAQEISLDLDMVSAACPDCRILLVEAKTASFSNLATGVNTAARLGAVAISNSYGGGDFNSSSIVAAYNHPGVAVTASTGDNGYGVSAPASFPYVTAVGGTSLSRDTSTTRGWTESVWSGAGSGCSALNPPPARQTAVTQCAGKANADVSAVADPATGVAVYDSYAYQGYSGWQQFGGTSASSPIIASVYAQGSATRETAGAANPADQTWAAATGLNDVTTGSNGSCPADTPQWCSGVAGWDGPTGLGTPNGTTAF